MHSSRLTIVALLALAGALGGCSKASDSSAPTYTVKAGDDTCKVETTELAPGAATFEVTNSGSQVTEVYLYGEQDGEFTKVVDEAEDIGPDTTRTLDVDLSEGSYQVTCKPGMVGDGISTKITVAEDKDN